MPPTQFNVWRALWDKITTKQNLQKGGVTMGDTYVSYVGGRRSPLHTFLFHVRYQLKFGICALVGLGLAR